MSAESSPGSPNSPDYRVYELSGSLTPEVWEHVTFFLGQVGCSMVEKATALPMQEQASMQLFVSRDDMILSAMQDEGKTLSEAIRLAGTAWNSLARRFVDSPAESGLRYLYIPDNPNFGLDTTDNMRGLDVRSLRQRLDTWQEQIDARGNKNKAYHQVLPRTLGRRRFEFLSRFADRQQQKYAATVKIDSDQG